MRASANVWRVSSKSSGSSSTIKTSNSLYFINASLFQPGHLGGLSHGEVESGAGANFRFRPDVAAVLVNHTLHRCQAYAYSLKVLAPVKPLENTEQLVDVPHIEADPVVADENHWRFAAFDLADLNDGRLFIARE